MNFIDLEEQVIDDLDSGIAVELQSSPGVGKSEFVTQLVKKLSARDNEEWGMSTMFLATQVPTDLSGYQFKGERVWDGEEHGRHAPLLVVASR